MPRVPFRLCSNKGRVTKHGFAGVPGSPKVYVTPPKVGYWKYAKRAVRYLMSKHKELMDCPPDGKPIILQLGNQPAAGMRLFITFRVPRTNGFTADYEALVFVWPARMGADVKAFRKIEGSEKEIESIDTTDDLRVLSPPSSDDEGRGPVPRDRVHTEDCVEGCSEHSFVEYSKDSDKDYDAKYNACFPMVWVMKPYFPNIPYRIHAFPPESKYWSMAERVVTRLMDTHKDMMDCSPNGRPKILKLGTRAKDDLVLYFAFQVPQQNGYTTDYETIAFIWPDGIPQILSVKKVKNSERPIESSDTTGGSLVSDDGCTSSRLSPDVEGSTMGSSVRYGDESLDDGSMMCVDADDDLSTSGTGLLSKHGTYIEKGSIMKGSDDASINEKVVFLGGATERLNIM